MKRQRRWVALALPLVCLALLAVLGPTLVDAAERNRSALRVTRAILTATPGQDDPGQPSAVPYLAGRGAYLRGDYEGAASFFRQASGPLPLAHEQLVSALVDGGEWRSALDEADTGDPVERRLYAEVLASHALSMTTSELADSLDAVTLDSEMAATYALGTLQQRRFQEVVEFVDSLDAAVATPQTDFYKARALYYLKDWPSAEQMFARLQRDGFGIWATYWHGRTVFQMGRSDAGLAEVWQFIGSLPVDRQPEYIAVYADMLAVVKRCAEATSLLDEALQRTPSKEGTAYLEDGRSRVAERCVKVQQ